MIEAEAKFIDQVVAKRVDFARRQPLGGVVAIAILKAAAIEDVLEGGGKEVIVVAVTEPYEKIVFVVHDLVNTNIKLVFCFTALGIRQEVSTGQSQVRGRRGKKIGQLLRQRIDGRAGAAGVRKFVGGGPGVVGAGGADR